MSREHYLILGCFMNQILIKLTKYYTFGKCDDTNCIMLNKKKIKQKFHLPVNAADETVPMQSVLPPWYKVFFNLPSKSSAQPQVKYGNDGCKKKYIFTPKSYLAHIIT